MESSVRSFIGSAQLEEEPVKIDGVMVTAGSPGPELYLRHDTQRNGFDEAALASIVSFPFSQG
jgi:hypothetical protein